MVSRLLCAVGLAVVTTTVAGQSAIGFAEHSQQVLENAGTRALMVVRSGSLAGTATVHYTTIGTSAQEGQDYTAASGTLTFGDLEAEKTILFTLLDDAVSDPINPRTIEVRLDEPTNATLGTWSSHFLYVSDDEPPLEPLTLSYEGLTFPEGDGEITTAVTMRLNRASSELVMLGFRRYQPPLLSDYNGANVELLSGVTFQPGETTKEVPLRIRGNDTYESVTKTWAFSVMPGVGNVLAPGFVITLVEDDPEPAVSISDVRVMEGSCGVTQVEVTLTTSAPASGLVQWSMSDGSATSSDFDYGPFGVYSPIRFLNSSTAVLNIVACAGDLKIEPDETFFIDLTSATNMTIARARGTVTIANDDVELPSFAEGGARFEEGDTALLTIRFPAPAPAAAIWLVSSDPALLVPAKVEVPERALSVSFAADVTKAVGSVTVTARLDPPLGDAFLSTTVDTIREPGLRFDESRGAVYAGETWTATLRLEPASPRPEIVMLTSSAGIVAPESVIVPAGGEVAFAYTALSTGTQWIAATRGKSTSSLFVDVRAQVVGSLSPDNGITSGGSVVAISGAGFSPGCQVSFGGLAGPTTFVSTSQILVTTPAHRADQVDVTVTCGATPVTLPDAFRFLPSHRRSARH